jgi:sporulation protein YlmC with PRC-barrel domain
MLKNSLAAGLLACAALTPVAFAQDAKPAQQERSSINFIKEIEKEQFRSTNLVGKTVYNLQDENIGSISDLILDRSGRVAAVIIGVGGFLGLGQSDVAVPMNSLKFVPDDQAMASAEKDAGSATGRAAADAEVEKQPGAAGQPSGTSTSAALPSQNVPDKGSAQQNAVEGAGQAKMDPAQSGAAKDANVAAKADGAKDASSSGYSTATVDASAGEDWLANMKVVLNTTREDLGSAPKLGETAADAPAK